MGQNNSRYAGKILLGIRMKIFTELGHNPTQFEKRQAGILFGIPLEFSFDTHSGNPSWIPPRTATEILQKVSLRIATKVCSGILSKIPSRTSPLSAEVPCRNP